MKDGLEQQQSAQLTRDEQIVAYFIQKCGTKRPIGRTQLMKLVYMADHEARRYLGRPLSALDYYWHFFGPYDERFKTIVDHLKVENVIREEPMVYPTGAKGFEYKPGVTVSEMVSLQPIEQEVLRYVCTTYSDVKLSTLLNDIVYQTAPMREAKDNDAKGERLNMDQVNDERRNEYGISFEELYARISEVRAGRGIPASSAATRKSCKHRSDQVQRTFNAGSAGRRSGSRSRPRNSATPLNPRAP